VGWEMATRREFVTPELAELLTAAEALARRRGQVEFLPEHVLLAALLAAEKGMRVSAPASIIRLLGHLGVALVPLRSELEAGLPSLASSDEGTTRPGAALRALLADAGREAESRGQSHISPTHVLLALAATPHGRAATLLRHAGVTRGRLAQLLRQRGAEATEPPGPTLPIQMKINGAIARPGAVPTDVLERYTRDLTRLATENQLDPVIGREGEIQRVLQVLGRRTKNNPLLLGEPGVGKTAIVEGLAQRIAAAEVPRHLRGRRLLALDLGALLAGTRLRGEFEERLQGLLDELRQAAGEILLFIDEIHLIMGAGGAPGQGALDAASLLKPSLARGEWCCIGATTAAEYRHHIERDGALERRFQPIWIAEAGVDETVRILTGLRSPYERHHGLQILDEAIDAAVHLTRRYVHGRCLPDKAIDALDEAAARLRLMIDDTGHPWAGPSDPPTTEDPQGTSSSCSSSGPTSVMPSVDAAAVARVVEEWTGVPVACLLEAERGRIARLGERLAARVVGQPEAVSRVAAAVQRARTGVADPRRPLGSFFFLGPPGVGKTELGRALAEVLFGDETALVRLDMSEYGEPHAVARLVGAPPGYLGHDEGGQLTEIVRRRPHVVLLLDEIEKAHAAICHLLLQVLDDGRLTDGLGRTVDFRQALIIMTSNLVAPAPLGGTTPEADVRTLLERRFRPEFLDRIDEVIVFRPLGPEELERIAALEVERVVHRLGKAGLRVEVEPEAVRLLGHRGRSAHQGARPLRRVIQRQLVDPLATRILLGGGLGRTALVRVTVADGEFVFYEAEDTSSAQVGE
jgi:ATP-dependent Clp protease ATP-binding subunit ClpC